MTNAAASGAPIGDMMVIVGTWLFGIVPRRPRVHARSGLHGVPRAHRHDALVPQHRRARHVRHGPRRRGAVALRHAARQEPDARTASIWTLAIISAVIGIITVTIYLGGTTPAPLDPKYHNIWYSFGIFDPDTHQQAAEHAGHRHADQQLRNVPALHAHVHHRDRGLPRAPQLQRLQAHGRAGVRPHREPAAACSSIIVGPFIVCGHEREGAVHRARRLRAHGASTARSTSCASSKAKGRAVLLDKPVTT